MARALPVVLAVVALAAGGCGLAGVPGLGLGGFTPFETPDVADVQPTLAAPVISDDAMERAVQAGLARSEADTWRMIEGCLTPTRSQVEQVLESLHDMRRPPGDAAGVNPLAAVRSANLDPRLGRARVLTQQGLLDAAYVLLVDLLCEYPDAGSKSTVLMELVSNREEAGDPESAVWFVEGWTRADEAGLRSQETFARQQQSQLQSARGRLMGSLLGGAQSAETTRLVQQQARDMRMHMLLAVATSYARLGDHERARQKIAEAQVLMAASPPAPSDVDDTGHLHYMLAEAAARVGDTPAALRAYAEGQRRRRDRARPEPAGASPGFVLAGLGQHAEAQRLAEATLAEATLAEAAGWSMEPRPGAERADATERQEAELERVSNQLVGAAALETAHTTLAEVAVAGGDGEGALGHLAEYDRAHMQRLGAQRAFASAMQRSASTTSGFAPVLDSVSAQVRATAYKERAQRAWRYGRAHMLAGRPHDAAARLLEAVAIVENLRGLIRPEDRVAFFGRHTSPCGALVDSLLGLPRTDDIPTLPAQHRGHTPAEVAFHYAEAARARLLSEQIARAFVGAAERDLPPDVRERERMLQNLAVAELRRGVPYDQSAAHGEFQRFVESLRRTHPDYATLRYPVPVTARQVPLRDHEALVAYAVLERRIAVWLLRKGEPLRVFTSPVRRGEDGFLTMSEVLKLPLRADMVVLSACQTALGREVTGEGVVGLSRAFLYAGSRAAVVSLWPVDDASTAVFMGKFYEHVKGGLPPARALARAKQDLRADARHAHPFHWAPFVFFGAD
jgi:CHAT domain-containing protein